MDLDFISKLVKPGKTKIVMLVLDGLGGLPIKEGGLTELETAKTPNLDKLAEKSICGLQIPISDGISPGSGPGHLSFFGYDPIKYQVGRGVLAANGIDFDLKSIDVAARGNFCTVDENGNVLDRRAGRISTDVNQQLCKKLCDNIEIPGVEIFIETIKEHRFLLVIRGEDLSAELYDTDPQAIGKKPHEPKLKKIGFNKTIDIVKSFIDQAGKILSENYPANMVLLRGFSKKPDWPLFPDIFGLKSGAISAYPMYRGLAKLIGMNLLETGQTIEGEFTTLEKNWNDYDFFFLHIKKTDSYGEDGNFYSKVKIIEEVDGLIPRLMNLNPDVIVITGDHSTPSFLKIHSWHPVPTLIYSKYCRPDNVKNFDEKSCITGGLGPRLPAVQIMPIAMANALRLEKFGA
ncbi:MAG: 2,3-bisphosphoglycerate-independent phosphoglycerate mutase [Thermoplasmatales archaeon]|nr:MAG: 2,3-bisphosphoglycerate-independent phosphoglycerate mutase [Thermoplasmatales archaeon]